MTQAAARDPARFVAEHTRLRPVPLVAEISLHVADEATALWQKTEEELEAIGLPPPFWAFAWAGGQALARHVCDHPGLVAGAVVLDVASGSGLVGLAAARVGAARVLANDIDVFATAAIALNASANGLSLDIVRRDMIDTDEGWDVVLAADIFYERETAGRVTRWLQALARRGARVLIGDPGRTYLDRALFEPIATYAVPVTRTLEDAEIKRTSVWRLRTV